MYLLKKIVEQPTFLPLIFFFFNVSAMLYNKPHSMHFSNIYDSYLITLYL